MDRIELFDTFVRVAEAGTLSRAARQLGCSLSAVSRRIDDLEAQLGAPLLDRTAGALRVTPAGERLLPRAVEIVRAFDDAREAVLADRPSDALVRISAPTPLGLTRVVPAVSALIAKMPHLRVEVVIDNELVSLEREGIDVVVRAGLVRLPESNELVARSLGRYAFVLCASPSYLARHGTPHSPDELASRPMLAHVSARGKRVSFRRGKDEVLVALNAAFWTNDLLAARAAAYEGIGIAALPEWLVHEDVVNESLRVVLPEWNAPTGEAWIAYRRRGRQRVAVRAVVAHLLASVDLDAPG